MFCNFETRLLVSMGVRCTPFRWPERNLTFSQAQGCVQTLHKLCGSVWKNMLNFGRLHWRWEDQAHVSYDTWRYLTYKGYHTSMIWLLETNSSWDTRLFVDVMRSSFSFLHKRFIQWTVGTCFEKDTFQSFARTLARYNWSSFHNSLCAPFRNDEYNYPIWRNKIKC